MTAYKTIAHGYTYWAIKYPNGTTVREGSQRKLFTTLKGANAHIKSLKEAAQ